MLAHCTVQIHGSTETMPVIIMRYFTPRMKRPGQPCDMIVCLSQRACVCTNARTHTHTLYRVR